jgi:hypothetical protein
MKAQRSHVANEGAVCITDPSHGPSLVLRSGREYCPHQGHDGNPKHKEKPTTPFLDKQVADDAADQSASA